MSEPITHNAVFDDTARLLQASDDIGPVFKQAVSAHRDFARLGSMTRWADKFSVALLTSFRSRWRRRQPNDRLEPKLAFVLGWLSHRAADRQMKPVFRKQDPDSQQSPSDCSIYHDVFIFREVYGGQPPLFAPQPAALVEQIHTLLQQSLLELHTLIPDGADPEAWINRLFDLQQTYRPTLDRYVAALTQPDPEKVRRYITEGNFYDRTDPIIVGVRNPRLTGAQVQQAVTAPARSHYAQALQLAYRYWLAAHEFFTSNQSPETLQERLDIGRPGRDGQSV